MLVVQNGQGVALLLKAARHESPVNTFIAFVSGIGAALSAAVGAVSSCLTGPTNALLTSSGEHGRQYTAALVFSVFGVLFGLMAPTFTGLMLAAPKGIHHGARRSRDAARTAKYPSWPPSAAASSALGALVSLLVTVADLGVLNIGAAFWAWSRASSCPG